MTGSPRFARRTMQGGGLAALAGFAGFGIGAWLEPEHAYVAYLAAWIYALSLGLGALCLVLIAHATRARWFVVVRRVAETVAGTIPLLALLFLPLLAGLDHVYPWARTSLAGLDQTAREAVHHRSVYMNEPFFVGRSLGYLAIWSGLAHWLRRWSLRQDAEGGGGSPLLFSGVGLFLFGFTVTFAAFDWLMSLSPTFFSTVFGLYFFAGCMVSALASMVLFCWALERVGVLEGKLADSHVHALGRLCLTFLVFWAYIAYAQGFLVWIADIPREVRWYLDRWEHGWKVVLGILIAGQFGLPFFLLLSRPFKRSHSAMAALGGWLLLMHYVDVFWLVVPSLAGRAASFSWLDGTSLLAVLGAGVAFAGWELTASAGYPVGDPHLATSLSYESP